MRIFLTGAFLLTLSSSSYNPAVASRHPLSSVGNSMYVTLESLSDRYRTLLVFAPSGKSTELVEQIRVLTAGSKELRQRQVIVVPVIAGSDARLSAGELNSGYFRPEEVAAVRLRFHVGEGESAVVLIGKDGGEKFRTQAPVTIETLDSVIDAMPMRRQEVRDGHAK